jgi:hypothetical protein
VPSVNGRRTYSTPRSSTARTDSRVDRPLSPGPLGLSAQRSLADLDVRPIGTGQTPRFSSPGRLGCPRSAGASRCGPSAVTTGGGRWVWRSPFCLPAPAWRSCWPRGATRARTAAAASRSRAGRPRPAQLSRLGLAAATRRVHRLGCRHVGLRLRDGWPGSGK